MKYPAVAMGMQRERVKPLHATYWTTVQGETEYQSNADWAVVPEPQLGKVQQTGEKGVD